MQSLIKFKKFIDELSSNNSRNYKITVLEKYKDDEDIKYYLNYIYNPYIVTGISDKKIDRMKGVDCYSSDFKAICFNNVKELLEYIKVNNTGKDVVLANIEAFKIFYFSPSYEEECKLYVDLEDLFNKIVTKNLPLGIDAKTINKVMNNLIPTFNVQLANKYFEDPSRVEGKEFALTTKIDGGRIIAIKKNGQAKFYTRQGQEYEGLVDLKEEMENNMPDNICLDGEITLLDKGNLTSKDQYKQTMKITRADGEKHGVKMLVFDMMTAEEFENQKCDVEYIIRRNNLQQLFSTEHKYFDLLPILYIGSDTSKITEWLNYNTAHGEEGVMINICDAKYEFNRTWNLIKVKKMQTLDLQIIGYEEGTNSNVGKLGAFIVRYRDGNVVKVGSGYTKELREEVWKNPDSYVGQIIEVQYFEETQNANGGISLRFPVFNDFRPDKAEADF